MDIAERISSYAVSLKYSDLTEHAIHTTKQRLIDSIGCALGAWESKPVQNALSFAKTVPAVSSTVFGTRRKTTPDIAAFANGTMVRYFDFNDGYIAKELAHPSDSIPACIAVAEAEGASGKDLILSIILAYEIQCRLVDAANLYKRGWDHVNYVLVATVVASGKLMKLSEVQMTEAINIAINGHIALRQVRAGKLSAWKGSSAANAARNGVFSALLARHGFEGPSPIFEGEMGFMKQITGEFQLDPQSFGNGQNKDYVISRTLTKLIPTQGEQHTAVFAAFELRKLVPDWRDIVSVHVDTTWVAYNILGKDPEKWQPQTRETADHSLPYTVARAIIDGKITIGSYSDDKIHDPTILEFMKHITVSEDPALTALFPKNIPNRVTIKLASGESFTSQHNAVVGGSDEERWKMTDDQFESKYHDLVAPFIPKSKSDKLLTLLWNVELEKDLSRILEAMVIE